MIPLKLHHKYLLLAMALCLSSWLASTTGSQRPGAAEEIITFIVQADSAARAAEAVLSVGGRVTSELGIIDAVGAALTSAQSARLHDGEIAVRVYENRGVELSTTIPTVRDDFDAQSFSGSDGSVPWTNPWQEIGESNGPT